MARVKRGMVSRRKHNKLLQLAKGYRGVKSSLIKPAHDAVLHANQYSFHGRKLRKRDFRSLWITRIGGAVEKEDLSYSRFIDLLKKANIELDRKVLSELVVNDPEAFKQVVKSVRPN